MNSSNWDWNALCYQTYDAFRGFCGKSGLSPDDLMGRILEPISELNPRIISLIHQIISDMIDKGHVITVRQNGKFVYRLTDEGEKVHLTFQDRREAVRRLSIR